MICHWSLSDSKFLQVSRTLLSILADLNNAAVWMVSTRSHISNSSSPFTSPLVTVPSATSTIGITVIYMCHSFFSVLLQGLGTYLSFRFLSVLFCGQPERQSLLFGRFFLLTITRSGLLVEIKLSVCISKSLMILCISFSWTNSIYYLLVL